MEIFFDEGSGLKHPEIFVSKNKPITIETDLLGITVSTLKPSSTITVTTNGTEIDLYNF